MAYNTEILIPKAPIVAEAVLTTDVTTRDGINSQLFHTVGADGEKLKLIKAVVSQTVSATSSTAKTVTVYLLKSGGSVYIPIAQLQMAAQSLTATVSPTESIYYFDSGLFLPAGAQLFASCTDADTTANRTVVYAELQSLTA